MHFPEDKIKSILHLARLQVPAEEKLKELVQDMERTLDWVDHLQAVDTTGVEPLTAVNLDAMPFRKDEVTDGGIQQKIIANAPEAEQGMFVAPKFVE